MKYTDITNRERNRYFYGKLLTVRDFELEQDYHIARRRLINRALFGTGVVCGLGVTASDDSTLLIESGLALDHAGREILIDKPLIRKLSMLEGYDGLMGRSTAWLCLGYDEESVEPVNAVGGETGARQYNKIEERFRLRLAPEAPDYRAVLESGGCTNVNILYQDENLTIAMWLPEVVCGGEEFAAEVLIVRNRETPPARFTLSGPTDFLMAEEDVLTLAAEQSPEDTHCVFRTEIRLRAKSVSGVTSRLFSEKAMLRVESGDHVYTGEIAPDVAILLTANAGEREELARVRESFERRCRTAELPIYLAKLELVSSSGGAFVCGVTNLPFAQTVRQEMGSQRPAAADAELTVKTSTSTLEYWQQPDIRANYSPLSHTLNLDFALPAPQSYDFMTAHGVETIALTGGMRVNSRYVTEEIPHGLGAGNVDVRTAVEFKSEDGECAVLFGSSEVFKSKQTKKTLPWVETAVITYPERGTMRIGVWLHDDVDGANLKIHWTASRPANDQNRIREKAAVSVSVMPEVVRLAPREKAHFRAMVSGSDDKAVTWSVRDASGGAIDENGIYQAPETKGTYEITAVASADPNMQASAFVIVE